MRPSTHSAICAEIQQEHLKRETRWLAERHQLLEQLAAAQREVIDLRAGAHVAGAAGVVEEDLMTKIQAFGLACYMGVPGADQIAMQDEIRAAIRSSLSVWRDINTAPKDGSLFLCWVESVRYEDDEETGDVRAVDVSAPDFGRWSALSEGSDGYYEPLAGLPGDHGAPTHWMPPPASPAPGAAQGEQS